MKRMVRGRSTALALLLALLAIAAGTFGLSAPAHAAEGSVGCYGDYCSGQDPVATGCGRDAVTVASHEQENGGGIVEVRWSPTCKTNWARWTAYPTGWCFNCGIVDLEAVQDTGYSQGLDMLGVTVAPGQSVWTPMIYSPVHRVKAAAMNPCGAEKIAEAAFDCAVNGWEETASV